MRKYINMLIMVLVVVSLIWSWTATPEQIVYVNAVSKKICSMLALVLIVGFFLIAPAWLEKDEENPSVRGYFKNMVGLMKAIILNRY